MSKYFKKEQVKKISLLDYFVQVKKELGDGSKQGELSLKYARIEHIYKALGDVQISEEMIETLCATFDSSKCRYGTICIKPETVKSIYEISEVIPELSKEALLSISREYIKDLFDKYSLIDTLIIMLRKEGIKDSTFKKFMDIVLDLASKEEKIYDEVAWYIRIHCGQYTYDFVKHFEQFVKEHHISWDKFYKSLPSPELILRDQLELKAIASRAKDCFGICEPITFQMFESYLDGDSELIDYDEQPSYYISTPSHKIPTSFTKTDFLESIEEKYKVKVK